VGILNLNPPLLLPEQSEARRAPAEVVRTNSLFLVVVGIAVVGTVVVVVVVVVAAAAAVVVAVGSRTQLCPDKQRMEEEEEEQGVRSLEGLTGKDLSTVGNPCQMMMMLMMMTHRETSQKGQAEKEGSERSKEEGRQDVVFGWDLQGVVAGGFCRIQIPVGAAVVVVVVVVVVRKGHKAVPLMDFRLRADLHIAVVAAAGVHVAD
jgi:hypothetical protein